MADLIELFNLPGATEKSIVWEHEGARRPRQVVPVEKYEIISPRPSLAPLIVMAGVGLLLAVTRQI